MISWASLNLGWSGAPQAHLHFLDFPNAEAQFDQVLSLDPYRIEDIDVYSNILYTTENKTKLSSLAQKYLQLDKNRPEVCCMVGASCRCLLADLSDYGRKGNHYSIRTEHEKAVKYFRRATQLDRTYFHAWTLMGHEYIEMSNTHAAIESYRRAVGMSAFSCSSITPASISSRRRE